MKNKYILEFNPSNNTWQVCRICERWSHVIFWDLPKHRAEAQALRMNLLEIDEC